MIFSFDWPGCVHAYNPRSATSNLFRSRTATQITISVYQGRIHSLWHEYIWRMCTACAADLFILTLTHWIASLWEQSPPGSVRARRTWRSLWARASFFPARWQATRPWMYRSLGLSTAKSSARQTDTLSMWEGWVWDEVENCVFVYLFISSLVCVFLKWMPSLLPQGKIILPVFFQENDWPPELFLCIFSPWILITVTH